MPYYSERRSDSRERQDSGRKRERSPDYGDYGRARHRPPFPDSREGSYGGGKEGGGYGGRGGYGYGPDYSSRGMTTGQGGHAYPQYGPPTGRGGGDPRYGRDEHRTGGYGPPMGKGGGGGYPSGGGNYGGGGGYPGGGGSGRGFAGGRDGGGRFQGGGGRGGGRGGRGANKHMGESEAMCDLVRRSEAVLGDQACMDIMQPPPSERQRDHLIEGEVQLPKLAAWRVKERAGLQLTAANSHIVRANFFSAPAQEIPREIFQYNISIFKKSALQDDDPEDLAKGKDRIFTTRLMKYVLKQHPEWHELGLAYDSGSTLYTSARLAFPTEDGDPGTTPGDADMDVSSGTNETPFCNGPRFEEDVTWPGARQASHKLIISPVSRIVPPIIDGKWVSGSGVLAQQGVAVDQEQAEAMEKRRRTAVMALDVALLSFARWRIADPAPQWIISGRNVFRMDGTVYDLSSKFIGMLGYHASLQSTLSGLSLVTDMSVTCFMRGGNLVDFACTVLRTQKDRLRDECQRGRRIAQELHELLDLLKNAKIRTTHLNQNKKFGSFGPAANSQESAFSADRNDTSEGGKLVTVAEYFEMMNGKNPKRHPVLRYPFLPTVNIGSKKRPVLVPMELIEIVPGQTRTRSITGDISAQIIKHAAMLPNDRFQNISAKSSLFEALADDQDAEHFGLSNVIAAVGSNHQPQRVTGTILPPPKLQYGNQVIEPQLRGAWNLIRTTLAHPAPLPHSGGSDGTYPYGAMLVHDGRDLDSSHSFDDLLRKLDQASRQLGIPLRQLSRAPVSVQHTDQRKIRDTLQHFQEDGARIVVVALVREHFYAEVKRSADELCLPTQCCRMTTVKKFPRNYDTSLAVKMNFKMGGVNHTLASRGGSNGNATAFQKPPQSVSWLFDKEAMVVGIDANKPESQPGVGGNRAAPTIVAVVASMDGMLGQYCAHISAAVPEENNDGVGAALTNAFIKLLQVFCERNEGVMPYHILVYRDGVAESQYESMLESEHVALRQAVALAGYTPDRVKISIVVCQKRHHTRLVYQAGPGTDFMNPCVGLVVDAQGSQFASAAQGVAAENTAGEDPMGCIMGANLNEFYLNSHAAVLGTSKPTKYVLVCDEIGFKMSELQLLTFWLTHLYCRCTRSVAIATPAYYAHWAARRGKILLNAGVEARALDELSSAWMKEGMPASMYFL